MSLHCTYAYVCVCVWNKLQHSKSFFTFRVQTIEPPFNGKSWKFYEFCHNILHWVIKSNDKRRFHYYPRNFLPATWNQELRHGEITLPTEGHTASKWRIQSFPSKVAAIFWVTALSHYIVQILITAIRSVLFLGEGGQ